MVLITEKPKGSGGFPGLEFHQYAFCKTLWDSKTLIPQGGWSDLLVGLLLFPRWLPGGSTNPQITSGCLPDSHRAISGKLWKTES